jgi:hypothetical protein
MNVTTVKVTMSPNALADYAALPAPDPKLLAEARRTRAERRRRDRRAARRAGYFA